MIIIVIIYEHCIILYNITRYPVSDQMYTYIILYQLFQQPCAFFI